MSDEEKQEKAYEVKDKRRINSDGTIKEDVAEAAAAGPAEGAPQGGQPSEEMPPPNVYAVVGFTLELLVEQAWIYMGLRVPQGMKTPPKDLVQAKLAIDIISSIAEKLDPHINEQEKQVMSNLLTDLRMNYVKQSE